MRQRVRVQEFHYAPIELGRMRDRSHMPHCRQHFVLGVRKRLGEEVLRCVV